MPNIRTCALAVAAVFFISSQASAQSHVTVVNTPLPVTVTNPLIPGTPVAFSLSNQPGGSPASFSVPLGKRLVIEYVSGQCVLGPNPWPAFLVSIVTSGVTNNHAIAIPFNPSVSGASVYQLGHLVKLYADAGTNVTLTVNPNVNGPQYAPSTCVLAFSGQLANL